MLIRQMAQEEVFIEEKATRGSVHRREGSSLVQHGSETSLWLREFILQFLYSYSCQRIVNRFEAQISLRTSFCALDLSKRNFSNIQNIFNIFYYLQTLFYIVYQVLIKSILKNLQNIFQKFCFWPAAVDRTPFRSTDLRPTESTHVSVCFGRPGGRLWAGNG